MTDRLDPAALGAALAHKTQVIDHLTLTLAHTRRCLELARAALESIALDEEPGGPADNYARCRETAVRTLSQL